MNVLMAMMTMTVKMKIVMLQLVNIVIIIMIFDDGVDNLPCQQGMAISIAMGT